MKGRKEKGEEEWIGYERALSYLLLSSRSLAGMD